MKRNEPVSHLMTKNLITSHVGEPLSAIRKKMAENHFHHMPIVSGEKLVGMISSTDLLRVTFGDSKDLREADALLDHSHKVSDLMTTQVVSVDSKSSVREATDILAEGRFHSLPVVDDGKLVGMLTTTDLLRYMLQQY